MSYRKIDFKTKTSPHLQLYYHSSDSTADHLMLEAERWYNMYQEILGDTLDGKNPLIMYNNHADFQQTTLASSNIGPGTGGFTESIRRRVVMPYTHMRRETNHVLGHELVHAFQYNLATNGDTLKLGDLSRIPLWVIEGLAEFLSIGRKDPHTAMWLRDAVEEDFFPSIADLSTPRYFPYRYGHAFWAFVCGLWGDKIIRKLFTNMALHGVDRGLFLTLGYNQARLSEMWKETTKEYYQSLLQNKKSLVGEVFFGDAESIVFSPVISPDGRYLAFYTQLDPIASLELIIVSTLSGRIIKRVSSLARTSHIDFLNPLESAPTWSPDNKKLGLVIYSKGRSVLSIVDAKSGKILKNLAPKEVRSMSYPSWSPDGRYIAFSGMKDGQSDLYLIDFQTGALDTLTKDIYSDIQPTWSPDGTQLVFSSDRPLRGEADDKKGFFNVCILNLEDRRVVGLPIFEGADNLNPQFMQDGGILFLSDRDGFRNLYRYDPRIQQVYLMTELATGISGITRYSQALSYAPSQNMIYYSLYRRGTYKVARAPMQTFQYIPVADSIINQAAGILPPSIPLKPERITPRLDSFDELEGVSEDSIKSVAYRPFFRVEGIASSGIGVASTIGLGTGLSGGVQLKISDILGNNDIYASASVNGEIYDFGAIFAYIHKKRRIDWGAQVGHIPQLSAFSSVSQGVVEINGVPTLVRQINFDIQRTFVEVASVLAFLPFSSTMRLQASLGTTFQSYRTDRTSDIYVLSGNRFVPYRRERRKLSTNLQPIFQYFGSLGFVGDKARMAIVGPLAGYRYHVSTSQYAGSITYNNVTVDGRYYFWLRPVSIAGRLFHSGRYGIGQEDPRLFPLNVAFPTLVRGYDFLSIYRSVNNLLLTNNSSGQFVPSDYLGNRVLVGNIECRLPLTGPKSLALIKSNIFFTELALFYDWGWAFSSAGYNNVLFGSGTRYTQKPITSAGISLRVNLFNILILEPFYAFPFQREYDDRRTGAPIFGINIAPAW